MAACKYMMVEYASAWYIDLDALQSETVSLQLEATLYGSAIHEV